MAKKKAAPPPKVYHGGNITAHVMVPKAQADAQAAQQAQQAAQQAYQQGSQDAGGADGGGSDDGVQSPYDAPTVPAGDTPWFDTDQPFDGAGDIDDSMSGPRRAPARMAGIGADPAVASPTQDVTTVVLFAAVAYFGWQWLKRGGR